MSLRRLDSFEKHKDSFTNLFSKCVGKIQDAPSIRNPQALEVLAQQIKEKFGSEVNADLEKIWDEFDADKNGELDTEENLKLTKNFLLNMKTWFQRMMEEVLSVTANPDLASKEGGKGETFARNVFAGSSQEFKPIVEDLFTKLLEDVKPMAEETFLMMDLNRDGKVVKSEFLTTFMSCASEIIRQLTLRAMFAMLSSGKVDFSKFVDDLDEEPGEDSTLIKKSFNEAVHEVASSQLGCASPCNLNEFWTSVCIALRKKVGCEASDSVKREQLGLPPLGGYLASPYGLPYPVASLGAYGSACGGYPYGGYAAPYSGYGLVGARPACSLPTPYAAPYATPYATPYTTPYGGYAAPYGGFAAPYGGYAAPYGGYAAPYGGCGLVGARPAYSLPAITPSVSPYAAAPRLAHSAISAYPFYSTPTTVSYSGYASHPCGSTAPVVASPTSASQNRSLSFVRSTIAAPFYCPRYGY